MLKIRITFLDDEKGNNEVNSHISELENNYEILEKSKIYKGRNKSKFSNIYITVDKK